MVSLNQYFPELSEAQLRQFSLLPSLYKEWNDKINVISRKDTENIFEHHVLHSLSIAKFISFKTGTRILDVGTGGGFPGIPLAIYFPGVQFHLVDSIGKKVKVVEAISSSIGLKNVVASQARAEELETNYDFVLTRAVAPLKLIYQWTRKLMSPHNRNEVPNGWICLKGGNLRSEINELRREVTIVNLSDHFDQEFFLGKVIIYFR